MASVHHVFVETHGETSRAVELTILEEGSTSGQLTLHVVCRMRGSASLFLLGVITTVDILEETLISCLNFQLVLEDCLELLASSKALL